MELPCFQPVDQSTAQELARRQRMLKSGSAPEWVFVCKAVNGLVTLPADGKQVMLLFTAPSAAKDYIDCVKLHAQVGQLKVDALPESARKWLAAGTAVFALNRCPRCSAFTTFAMESLIQGHYFDAWALIRALQSLRGEASMQEYMGLSSRKSLQQGRAVLEQIRDHIDAGSPYLFELIAFLAGTAGDDAAKAAAIARLKQFDRKFHDWESRWSPALPDRPFARALSEATVGLNAYFGNLQTPNQPQG